MARSRWRWPVLVLSTVIAAAFGGMQWAGSQGALRDGAFVVAQDGSRWVVSGGQKHRIEFTVDDTNALAGLPEGNPVATLGDVPVSSGGPPPPPPPAQAGIPGLTADYQFQGSLASSCCSAPELQTLGNTGFGMDRVNGPERTVMTFTEGSGLRLSPASRVIASDSYSIAVLFRFSNVSGFRRLIDFKDGSVDSGVYVYNGALRFYTVEGAEGGNIAANSYVQVVITRGPDGTVVGYLDGVRQFVFTDTQGLAVVSASNVVRFFRDDSNTEHSAGGVARIRLFDRPLGADEVAALDR
jgi:hypothetical protein